MALHMKAHFASECDLTTNRDYVAASTLLRSRMPGYSLLLAGAPVIATRRIPTAGTDGGYLYVNPDFFASLATVEHRAALLAHEAGHIALRHPLRGEHYRRRGFGPNGTRWCHRTYNAAGDYVINADIVAAGLPLPCEGGLLSPQFTRNDLVDSVYVTLLQEQDQQDQQREQQQEQQQREQQQDQQDQSDDCSQDVDSEDGTDNASEHDGHDVHLHPSYDGTLQEQQDQLQADIEQAEREIDRACDLQDQEAREQRSCRTPSEAMREAGRRAAIESATPWQQLLADIVTRSGRGGEHTMRRINKRKFALMGVVAPTQEGFLKELAVTVDISLSVDRARCDAFMAEVAYLIDLLRPETVLLIQCSDYVVAVDTVTSGAELLDIKRGCGGGTTMHRACDWLADNGYAPDVHLIFTDGEMDDSDWQRCHDAGARIVLDGTPNYWAQRGAQACGHTPIICGG